MNIASVHSARLMICPQCGDDWSAHEQAQKRGFCPRCGSPVSAFSYDPLRPVVGSSKPLTVNNRAKLVVRIGILGLGLVGLISGGVFFYGGWINSESLDPIQLWVSRLGALILLYQGLLYSWVPFRKPPRAAATILPFRKL